MATQERLDQLGVGYDLDTGGYGFENAPRVLGGAVVVWDDPDLDYLGLQDVVRTSDYSCPVLAFAPNSGHFQRHEFPATYEVEGFGTMVKVAEGDLSASTHDCHCHGKLVSWTGAAGEPSEPLSGVQVAEYVHAGVVVEDAPNFNRLFFESSGDTGDHPLPDCPRCDGEGSLMSEGGEWAVYALQEEK